MTTQERDLTDLIRTHFREPGAFLAEMVARRHAECVKQNAERSIFRVHLGGHDLHVKCCRATGWRAWLRERFRPAKAKLEYQHLLQAAARGVTVVPAVGCAVARRESFLITQTIPDTDSLTRFFETQGAPAPRTRIALARALGRFIAVVHHAGIRHPDLHPGNLLIRWTDAAPEFFLLDLHNARIGRPLNQRASIANLALLNRWFILRGSRCDRLRFWQAYVIERFRLSRQCPVDYFAARDVECATRRSNRRLWKSRLNRCLGVNRRFQRFAVGDISGHAVADWRLDVLRALGQNADALFDSARHRLLKDSRSSSVAVSEVAVNGMNQQVLCKRLRARSFWRSLAAHFHLDPCSRSWINGHAFRDSLLHTPRPLALWRDRQAGESCLITEFIPGAIDLRQAVKCHWRQRRERIDRIARLVRDLHERDWAHRDLKAVNILLAPDGRGGEKAWFIDLVGAFRPFVLTRRRRAKDLARLNASFHDLPSLSRTDRLRFLLRYLNVNLHGGADWRSWWRQIDRLTRRKVARNRRRGRPLA